VVLNCYNNQLTNLSFLNDLKGRKLTYLYIYNNNLSGDLVPLRGFVNLGLLRLDGNNLTGSLEPLVGLVKLNWLDISDTNIDSG